MSALSTKFRVVFAEVYISPLVLFLIEVWAYIQYNGSDACLVVHIVESFYTSVPSFWAPLPNPFSSIY